MLAACTDAGRSWPPSLPADLASWARHRSDIQANELSSAWMFKYLWTLSVAQMLRLAARSDVTVATGAVAHGGAPQTPTTRQKANIWIRQRECTTLKGRLVV